MTNQADETRRIVKTFLEAWAAGDERAARALVADDVVYTNVLTTYRGADALLPPLFGFAKMMRGAPIDHIVAEGSSAAVLYDCDCPAPIGMLRTAWFVRIEGGRIREIRSVFDATELRKIAARPEPA